jgi:hypothetical protein
VGLTQEIMDKVSHYMRTVDDQQEDSLAPLRKAMGEVADLNEAVTRAEGRPKEERLSLGRS